MEIDPRILERRRKVGSELKPGYEDRKDDLRWEMKHERLRLASRCCALETTGYHPHQQMHICARRSGHRGDHHDYDTGFHWKWDKEEGTTSS